MGLCYRAADQPHTKANASTLLKTNSRQKTPDRPQSQAMQGKDKEDTRKLKESPGNFFKVFRETIRTCLETLKVSKMILGVKNANLQISGGPWTKLVARRVCVGTSAGLERAFWTTVWRPRFLNVCANQKRTANVIKHVWRFHLTPNLVAQSVGTQKV